MYKNWEVLVAGYGSVDKYILWTSLASLYGDLLGQGITLDNVISIRVAPNVK